MATKTAARLHQTLINAGIGRVRSYSGRFMYGKSCIGIALSRGESPTELGNLRFAGPSRQDSLGLGMIVYWPQHEWDAETMNETARG
jgi:hypothetical protein